ncbi:hypothetical protein EV186_102767 [Labedaea rhizosphaerae]|uniref:Uncharacterized protein n=2 Tax=Labedaea rhizosphaerae TaxID=598644 RepID=A0A4V3CZT0_LABRH|nr:hypothetical protein EV186_102767 [Labedaea rhizosphaerae]
MTLAQGNTPQKSQRTWIRMECPGIAPPAPRVSDEGMGGIGGRGAGWPGPLPEEEDGLEPTIVRGRE